MTEQTVRVDVTNHSTWPGLDLDHWSKVVADTIVGEGVPTGSLDLIFVDADEMADLNHRFMGQQGPTDVLSFPLDNPYATGVLLSADGDADAEPIPVHIGDVIVCPAVAAAQAPGHCGHLAAEVTLLIVHGILHVLGHDHAEPDQAAVMVEREESHMTRCGFSHPGPVQP